jgi:hypothetical protein
MQSAHHLQPTARKRRKHHKKAAAPKRRRTHRKKGLAEGLSAGISGAVQPVMMGIFGGFAGLIVNSFFPTASPMMKILIGAAGAGILTTAVKAPNFGAGFAAGMTMPAIGQLLQPDANKTMNEGYLMEDLPAIIDDGELSEANFLSAGYLQESEFDGLEA